MIFLTSLYILELINYLLPIFLILIILIKVFSKEKLLLSLIKDRSHFGILFKVYLFSMMMILFAFIFIDKNKFSQKIDISLLSFSLVSLFIIFILYLTFVFLFLHLEKRGLFNKFKEKMNFDRKFIYDDLNIEDIKNDYAYFSESGLHFFDENKSYKFEELSLTLYFIKIEYKVYIKVQLVNNMPLTYDLNKSNSNLFEFNNEIYAIIKKHNICIENIEEGISEINTILFNNGRYII